MILLLVLSMLFAGAVAAEDATALHAEADAHYSQREVAGEVEKAIEGYRKILELDNSNFDAARKLSKAYWYLGNHSSKSKSEKKQYFELGVEQAKRAIQINPNSCRGHFWLGVNYGMVAETAGMFEALGMLDQIKSAVEQAEKIDKNCECGGPQRVLGKLYSKAPFFKGGSKSKAIRSLQESLELCPNDTQSRIFLAEIYIDQNKRGLAIQQLKLVLKQKPASDWIPETKENKALAQKMLTGLEDRRVR